MADRILVKLRSSGTALRAASSRVRMEPLYESRPTLAAASTAQWFIVEPVAQESVWDAAHDSVAKQLGVGEDEVLFAEPDLIHDIFRDGNEIPPGQAFAVGEACQNTPQDGTHGKIPGPTWDWHLSDEHSQLGAARAAVSFAAPRTRIAHIDTGYSRMHETMPVNVMRALERSFVDADADSGSAEDPDRKVPILDNSGHGTGTIGILAGKRSSILGGVIGAAPDAEVLPLRVADRVVLLRTSALARAFRYAADQQCDVITLSMGGLPSQAWSEAVDAIYEAGVCLCAAAGNHVGPTPPRTLVYPARYPRVIAVCGVMADGSPYVDLKGTTLEGSHGPESAMGAAIAAYTPNIPWARFGCDTAIRLDGEGTSSATPQVAAAVALWIEKHKASLPRDWRRVEAVRRALFSTARIKTRKGVFGNGILQARAALDVQPVLTLPKSAESKNSFAFLRLITGLGVDGVSAREQMFNLELAQRWLVNPALQEIVPDPDRTAELSAGDLKTVMDAIIADPGASNALRRHVAQRYPALNHTSPRSTPATRNVVPKEAAACSDPPALPDPPSRRLRVYAVDPSFSTQFATADSNEVTLDVRWEALKPGPSGDYFVVDDVDASGKRYKPVNLDSPRLLAQEGWAPSEGNPQFHQQMVYAVAMRTVEQFERSLGRPVLWRPLANPADPSDDSTPQLQLPIRPHALRQANAYFSPEQVALLFGYFDIDASQADGQMPGSRVFTCLSHDIVAHETTHAILDGMHRRFVEASNPDVLAFHEAFADIVALLQHFTIPDILYREITHTRGRLETESMLGSLAIQFGQARGGHGALRQAIGTVENGKWRRLEPNPRALPSLLEPHARGSILVAAVFDAFLACYNARTEDLFRLATGGTGVLPDGAIHPDLARRLADEAATVARQVLNMCIRAIDYLPPVDVTFFEYLRALITADLDVVRQDRFKFRVAFVEAFRRHGIYPMDLSADAADDTPRTLSVEMLRWRGLADVQMKRSSREAIRSELRDIVRGPLRKFADTTLYVPERELLFKLSRIERGRLHGTLKAAFKKVPDIATQLGMLPDVPFEVHQIHSAMRLTGSGRPAPQIIIRLLQDAAAPLKGPIGGAFRGGSTLIVDLTIADVKYAIVKRVTSESRRQRTEHFHASVAADPLKRLLLGAAGGEPFGLLHAFGEYV